jgi:phage antirepressor YoqD-like protein
MQLTTANITMSSREIAKLVDSRHSDVVRTIDRLIDRGVVSGCAPSAYTHEQNGQTYMEYLVSKRDSYVIVAQLCPEFTARLVDRWQELEQQVIQVPTTLSGALRLAAEQAEQIERQQALIEQQKPAVQFVESYVQSEGLLGFRQVAKLLQANERQFRQMLLDQGVMYYLAGALTPMAAHINAGRFEVKTGTSENEHAYTQAKFTPKGVQWVAGLWAAHKMGA